MITSTVSTKYAFPANAKEDELRPLDAPQQGKQPTLPVDLMEQPSPQMPTTCGSASCHIMAAGFTRPVKTTSNWRSENPIDQAEARNGLYELIEMVSGWSRNILAAIGTGLQLIPKIVCVALGWTVIGFTGVYSLFTATDTVRAARKKKQLDNCEITSPKMQHTQKLASVQAAGRKKLKGLATAASSFQLTGGSICLISGNLFHPVGWAFLGGGVVLAAGWFSYKAITGIKNRNLPIQDKPASRPQAIATDLHNGLCDNDEEIQRDSIVLLEALGILKPDLTIDSLKQSRDKSIELIAQQLRGADDYLL